MHTPHSPTLEETVEALKRSPVFQISLASKELFHSNFLAWLCEQYPDQAGELLSEFVTPRPTTYQPLIVQREKKNIDLLLTFPDGGKLVIENKVKSLPSLVQLDEYAAEFAETKQRGFLIVSLIRPSFDGGNWDYMSYRELADRLRTNVLPVVAKADTYHGALLEDYIGFIKLLDLLQSHFVPNWDNPQGDFFEADEHLEKLRSIRMHDVFDKLRYAELAERIATALKDKGFDVVHQSLPTGDPNQVAISAGLTRSLGLFDAKYLLTCIGRRKEPVFLGVQIQGKQFRLNVETTRRGKHAERIAEALLKTHAKNRLWFDLSKVPSASDEYPLGGGFNQYSGLFFYRSKKLGQVTPGRLVDSVVGFMEHVRDHAGVLRKRIESAYKRSH